MWNHVQKLENSKTSATQQNWEMATPNHTSRRKVAKSLSVCGLVSCRGLHVDWVPPGPAGPNPNLAGAGGLNFAAGGNGRLKQTLWERQDDRVNN